MATVLSDQLSNDVDVSTRKRTTADHGKLRIQYFSYTNATGGTLAAATQIDLCFLPPGTTRLLPNLSRYRCTALGASRTLDIGHRAYTSALLPALVTEAENGTAFVSAKDVSGAVNDVAFDAGATKMKYDMYGSKGKKLFATVNGGTIPAAAVLEGYAIYVYD